MSPIRRLLVGLLSLPVLLIALVLALPFFLSHDAIRDRVLQTVQSALHRPVEARAIHLEVFGGLGVRIEGLRVGNPPGWQTPALATVERLSLKVALRPLLSRRVEVREIRVEGAAVAIERDPEGRWNFGDLREPAGAGGGKPSGPAPAVLVERIRLSGGRFLFLDRRTSGEKPVAVSLDDLDAEISDIAPGSSPRFELAGRLLADADRNVFVEGVIEPPPPGKGLDAASWRARIVAKELAVGRLRRSLGSGANVDPGVLSIDATLRRATTGVVTMEGAVALAAPPRSPAIPSFQASLALTLDQPNRAVGIERAALTVARVPLRAEGQIRDMPDTPRFDLRIETPHGLSIAELTHLPGLAKSLPPGLELSGRARLETRIHGSPGQVSARAALEAGPLSIVRRGEPILVTPALRATLDAPGGGSWSGRVTAVSGRLQKLPFEDLATDWAWDDGALTLTPTMHAFGGVLRGRFETDLSDPKTESRVSLEVARVEAERLARSLESDRDDVSGTLTAKLSLASRGLAAELFRKTARGEGRVSLANADLKTVELMPKVARALSTVGRIAGFQVPGGFEATRFRSLEATLRLEEGRIRTPDLTMKGQEVTVTADGWISYDQTLSYEGRLVIGPGILEGLGATGRSLAGELGSVSLPFRVSGPVSAPNVDVDYSVALDLGKRLARRPGAWVKGVVGRVVEQVRERVEGRRFEPPAFLRRLFGRSPGSP